MNDELSANGDCRHFLQADRKGDEGGRTVVLLA